jgi:hypothetical protein
MKKLHGYERGYGHTCSIYFRVRKRMMDHQSQSGIQAIILKEKTRMRTQSWL